MLLVAALMFPIAGCAVLPAPSGGAGASAQDASAMLAEWARTASLTPAQRRRETTELESVRPLGAAHRFRLAALLAREDGAEALERSLALLGGLAPPDASAETLLDLVRAVLKARLELTQQTARTQALQEKLDQIKTLEKSLQQRTSPTKTP